MSLTAMTPLLTPLGFIVPPQSGEWIPHQVRNDIRSFWSCTRRLRLSGRDLMTYHSWGESPLADQLLPAVADAIDVQSVHGEQPADHGDCGVIPVVCTLRIEPDAVAEVIGDALQPEDAGGVGALVVVVLEVLEMGTGVGGREEQAA